MENHRNTVSVCARFAIGAVCTSLFLSGCASVGGGASSKVAATTRAEYYPSCYEPVSHLRSSDAAMQKSVATGAVTGGLLGGLTGALAGGGDHTARNALIGAATGALVGGAVGYYTERQKQITDDQARIASYGADIDASVGDMDRSIAYASAAQDCYQREFTNLQAAHKSGKITEAEGKKRFTEIVSGLKETNALLAAVDGRAGENIDTYTQAYEKDLQQIGVQRQTVTQVAKAETKKPVVASTVPKAAVDTEKKLQQADTKRTQIKQVTSRGTSLISSACNNPDVGDWGAEQCSSV
ncbi:type VI secretion system-associated lipoprotein TagQ [Pseudomonas indica]|uniref:Glycine zipper n=1 Tax=Pseudomonas indica TaxID=137658 RepID=A0A1G9A2S0_9PSED|nr:type VI secretion system-associated lipoprotein TagQ [Pseudomonas indica]MBU3057949.1 type VI secretion-associated lipoprotein TagQ [Pseudomonas indica]SDK21638.1 Glycine zipper [Pseudomonas indica]